MQNGDETGVDCGGSGDCLGCAAGIACRADSDCASAVCTESICRAPRCDDGVKNGSESDRDCGTGCTPCALNRSCISNDDCMSKSCAEICVSSLHVDLFCSDRSTSATSPQPYFRIVNAGNVAFPLSSLSLRYYYSKDVSGTEQFNCYTVSGGDCTLLAPARFGDVTPKTATADRYVELHYAAKAPSLAVNQTSEIHGAFFVPSYAPFIQTNDYSFSTNDGFQTADHVTLYANGVLIWGVEP